jgi:Arg-Lys translocation region protein phosphatase
MDRLSFPLRSAISVTAVTFCCFLAVIYLEDYFLFHPNSKYYTRFIGPEVYLGRILSALGLSLLNGIFVFLFTAAFISQLTAFSRMVLDWARKQFSDYELLEDSGYREINHIKEVFRSSVHAVKARDAKAMNDIINENNNLFIEQILEIVHSIKIPKLDGIDVHLVPNQSKNPKNDLMGLVPTRNGCIFIMTGSKKHNVLTASYKARIQTIIQMSRYLNYTAEEELISAIQESIRPYPIDGLNFTLLYAMSDARLIKFLHFQETPILLYTNGKLSEIPVIGETQYPFMEFSSDLRMEKILSGSFLVILTDRLLERSAFGKGKYIEDLKKIFSSSKKNFSNSKDFYNFFYKSLESIFKNNGGTEDLEDFLSIFIIQII